MFSHIKTSKENKEIITKLTNKLNLGTENIIARIALAYSLAQDRKLDIKDLKDSGGKEYSRNVLLGENYNVYVGIICLKHSLHSSDKDIQRYIKLYLDNGIESFKRLVTLNSNFELSSFLANAISHFNRE